MLAYLIGLALLGGLQLLDVWTTNRVIAGGGRESNPVLIWVMLRLGRRWWIFKLGVAAAFIAILYLVGPQPLSWAVLAVLLAAYLWVVRHNWREGS